MMTEHIGLLLNEVVENNPKRLATRIFRNGGWQTQTYAEFANCVYQVATSFLAWGFGVGDRIAIFAPNTPEWSQIDFGALTARVVPVPIYATSTPDQIRHIMRDSGARAIFVGGQSEAGRLLKVVGGLPELKHIVALETWDAKPGHITTYSDFLNLRDDKAIAERLGGATGDDLASIIYTSGTTGEPKGVMLRHSALVAQKRALDQLFPMTSTDHSLAFLPLSHALERGWTTVVLLNGCMNTYVADPRMVAEQLVMAKPTLVVSVPKLYETVYFTAQEKAGKSGIKRRIFDWALRQGHHRWKAQKNETSISGLGAIKLKIAESLVFNSIKEAIGGEKSVLACGGAPIRPEIEEFFAAIGLPIYTGYGLTEASPLVSFNSPQGTKNGSVGKVMQGSEIQISDEGEVLYRGPNLMVGYWNNEDATEAAFVDGWLRTGDIGHIDSDGYLFITDRMKDIIVTLGGKNVSPQPIESLLLADPLFEHAVILGDNRPFLTLLVKPSTPQVEELGRILQWPGGLTDWLRSTELLEELRTRVKERTSGLPSQDQPKETAVMDEGPTMDNELLTPTLKIRRAKVEQRFSSIIEEMYSRLERVRKRK